MPSVCVCVCVARMRSHRATLSARRRAQRDRQTDRQPGVSRSAILAPRIHAARVCQPLQQPPLRSPHDCRRRDIVADFRSLPVSGGSRILRGTVRTATERHAAFAASVCRSHVTTDLATRVQDGKRSAVSFVRIARSRCIDAEYCYVAWSVCADNPVRMPGQ